MNGVYGATAGASGIISLCALRAGDGLFGIDTSQMREVLGATALERVPLAPAYIAGVAPYRGEVLTTVSLRVLLGLEQSARPGRVLVLDDEENGERFGLMVDGVGGVVTLPRDSVETNPSTLDARSIALFDGVYRMQTRLIVRLDPRRLQPARLAQSGLFGAARRGDIGEQRCER